MLLRWVFIITITIPSLSYATFRIGGGIGLGSSSSTNETTSSEGPLTQLYTVETILHSKLVGGVENLRSLQLSPISTAISFTGLYAQYYITSIPTPYTRADDLNVSAMTFRDYGFFVGSGFGLGQSSRAPDINGLTSNAAGIYISPRAGVDIQLSNKFGLRSLLIIGLTVMGEGQLSSFSIIESVYWSF